MKHYFSIGEAAKAVQTTTETLRHYDRIGLVKPSKKDEWTNYRYYTEQDLVRLNTVRALQLMELPHCNAVNPKSSWQRQTMNGNYRRPKIQMARLSKRFRNA